MIDALLSRLTIEVALGLVAALAAAVWLAVFVQYASLGTPRARGRALLLLLMASGPGILLAQNGTPEEEGPSGALLVLSQAMTVLSLTCALVLFAGARHRERNRLTNAFGVLYLVMLVSGFVGVVQGVPQSYIVTPIVVLAVAQADDLRLDDVVRYASYSLRSVMVLSLAAIVIFPATAFDTTDLRTLGGLQRLQGITTQPNTLGILAALGLVIELHRRRKIWMVVALGPLVLTQSRTSQVAAAVAVLVGTSMASRLARRFGIAMALATAGAAIAVPVILDRIVAAVTPSGADTLTGRTKIWDAALVGFKENPLLGYGPGLLDDAYRDQYLPGFGAGAQAHNQVVQTLGDTGLVGLAALIAVVATMVAMAHRVRPMTVLPFSLVAALIVRGVSETPLRPSGVSATTFVLLIVVAVLVTASREYRSGEQSDTAHRRVVDADRRGR